VWLAALAAAFSAVCAGFSAYTSWRQAKNFEQTVRPRIKIANTVVRQLPACTQVEIGELRNLGPGDAQNVEIELMVRETMLTAKTWRASLRRLDVGEKADRVVIRVDDPVDSSHGRMRLNEYFKHDGLMLRVSYQNVWTGDSYQETWKQDAWTFEDKSAGGSQGPPS